MSLEEALKANTAALEANTAALLKGGSASTSTGTKTTKTEPKADAYTPAHTKDEMVAALNEVKEKFGVPVAKGIIAEQTGKEQKMADVSDPKHIDACYKAAKAKLKEEEV